ncbi:MAG: GlxA family transcriptional regulator [Anderseniella sp.]
MTILPILMDFLLLDGFSNMVLASGLEPLRAANSLSGQKLYEWRLLSVEGSTATSSSGIEIRCKDLDSVSRLPENLFAIAGVGARDHATRTTSAALRRLDHHGCDLGAIDMGAWLLASAGVLDGYRATVHWEELGDFAETFPNVKVVSDRFVADGPRVSAGGATAGLEMMISRIYSDYGSALAFDVTNMFVYDAEMKYREGRGAINLSVSNRSPQLLKAIDAMRAHIEEPLSVNQVALLASCSQRTLTRIFLREINVSPGRYYASIRLSAARRLVEETRLSCSHIAAKTGFSSSASLARAYSAHYGTTIRKHRAGRLN